MLRANPTGGTRMSDVKGNAQSGHLGLKILLGLILVATAIYTWRALMTQLSMVLNTVVWIAAIALMIFLYVRIRRATE